METYIEVISGGLSGGYIIVIIWAWGIGLTRKMHSGDIMSATWVYTAIIQITTA